MPMRGRQEEAAGRREEGGREKRREGCGGIYLLPGCRGSTHRVKCTI